MKKNISVIASAVLLGGLLMTGCGSNSTSGGSTSGGSTSGGSTSGGSTSGGSTSGGAIVTPANGSITIKGLNNTDTVVDPAKGGTVVTSRNSDGSNSTAAVVHAELNECTDIPTLGSRVACGPKEGVTYIFQSDFSKLQRYLDDNISTPDGGVLLYDALTSYDGELYTTPSEGNTEANRIEAVYIPTNYIVLDDQVAGDKSTTLEKYEYMREFLNNTCNMKCMFNEFDKVTNPDSTTAEPFFTDTKDEGKFIATYVMHFTRGISSDTLDSQFADGNTTNLEYLWVSFEVDAKRGGDRVDNRVQFKTPAGSQVVFGGKRAGHDEAIQVQTTNDIMNMTSHANGIDDWNDALPINMAKYFDKLVHSGAIAGEGSLATFAKEILVENALNPWPVKIYGTLHEYTVTLPDGTPGNIKRSFVRNPAKLDANLFNLNEAGPYKYAFNADPDDKANAQKFILVYPGGNYNKLD